MGFVELMAVLCFLTVLGGVIVVCVEYNDNINRWKELDVTKSDLITKQVCGLYYGGDGVTCYFDDCVEQGMDVHEACHSLIFNDYNHFCEVGYDE
jgi:hypothetical protein